MKKRTLFSVLLVIVLALTARGSNAEEVGGSEENKEPFKLGFSALPSYYL